MVYSVIRRVLYTVWTEPDRRNLGAVLHATVTHPCACADHAWTVVLNLTFEKGCPRSVPPSLHFRVSFRGILFVTFSLAETAWVVGRSEPPKKRGRNRRQDDNLDLKPRQYMCTSHKDAGLPISISAKEGFTV